MILCAFTHVGINEETKKLTSDQDSRWSGGSLVEPNTLDLVRRTNSEQPLAIEIPAEVSG